MQIRPWIPMLAALLLLAVACATKPPTPEPTPPPVTAPVPTPAPLPAPEPTPQAPTVDKAAVYPLRDEATALRKRAFDLGLAELLAEDWKKADQSYVNASSAYASQSWQAALDGFTAAKGLFADLLPRGLVLLADRAKTRAQEWRKVALDAGADSRSTQRFALAEGAASSAQANRDAGKNEEAATGWDRARALYELSEKHAKALALKTLVEQKTYAPWDRGNAEKAIGLLADENLLFTEKGGASLADASKGIDILLEVILRYNLVVAKGRESIALDARGKSDLSKSKAKEIKADVAVKAEYARAVDRAAAAAIDFDAGRFEDSTTGFAEAAALFDAASALAADKRKAALDAMQAADSAHGASVEAARKAELEIAATNPDASAATSPDGSH